MSVSVASPRTVTRRLIRTDSRSPAAFSRITRATTPMPHTVEYGWFCSAGQNTLR